MSHECLQDDQDSGRNVVPTAPISRNLHRDNAAAMEAERKSRHRKVNASTLQFDVQTLWQPTRMSRSEDNIHVLTAVNDDTQYRVNDEAKCNARPPSTVNDSGLDKARTSSVASTSGARRPTITDQDQPLAAPDGPERVREPIAKKDEGATNGGLRTRRRHHKMLAHVHTQRPVTKARSEDNIIVATLGYDSTTTNVNKTTHSGKSTTAHSLLKDQMLPFSNHPIMPNMSPVHVHGSVVPIQESRSYLIHGRDTVAGLCLSASVSPVVSRDEFEGRMKKLRGELETQMNDFKQVLELLTELETRMKKRKEDAKTVTK